jgi:hypothetical protein
MAASSPILIRPGWSRALARSPAPGGRCRPAPPLRPLRRALGANREVGSPADGWRVGGSALDWPAESALRRRARAGRRAPPRLLGRPDDRRALPGAYGLDRSTPAAREPNREAVGVDTHILSHPRPSRLRHERVCLRPWAAVGSPPPAARAGPRARTARAGAPEAEPGWLRPDLVAGVDQSTCDEPIHAGSRRIRDTADLDSLSAPAQSASRGSDPGRALRPSARPARAAATPGPFCDPRDRLPYATLRRRTRTL